MKRLVVSALLVIARKLLRPKRSTQVSSRLQPVVAKRPDAVQRAVLVMLPVWVFAGLADNLWHRRTHIHTTSGTEESITHALMIAEMGPAVAAALLLEINAGVLALVIACYLAHEATVAWDIFFTAGRRVIPPGEQQIHGYLQAVPSCLLTFLIFTHWDQFLALLSLGSSKARFELKFKQRALPLKYLIPLLVGSASITGAAHAEEIWRCLKASRMGLTGKDSPECASEYSVRDDTSRHIHVAS